MACNMVTWSCNEIMSHTVKHMPHMLVQYNHTIMNMVTDMRSCTHGLQHGHTVMHMLSYTQVMHMYTQSHPHSRSQLYIYMYPHVTYTHAPPDSHVCAHTHRGPLLR